MKKLRILLILLIAFIITGCSFLVLNSNKERDSFNRERVQETDNENQTVDVPKEEPVYNKNQDSSEIDIPADKTKEETQEEAPDIESQPQTKANKLDCDVLDKLDNTKFGWGLRLNNDHTTPGIPSHVNELIDKYDGIFTGDTSQKVVYLTFDEGYENGYTSKILDTLKANDVKSIFFVTGSYVDRNPELVKRMAEEGHEIGNHTVNHPSLPDIDNAKIEKEILELEEKVYSQYGVQMRYMRPPNGEYSERTLEAARQLGYKTVFWSFAYKDWDVNDQKGADYAYNKVMDNLHNGAVILLHAVSKDNAEALDRIIKAIREEGYEIMPFNL
ncbi:MAG: delta-lactam-biosynthetic de-N-acetylase [Acetivibrionales bacterium]